MTEYIALAQFRNVMNKVAFVEVYKGQLVFSYSSESARNSGIINMQKRCKKKNIEVSFKLLVKQDKPAEDTEHVENV